MKKLSKSVKKFFRNLGPGLITGASDDDPSGIATYSQAGAQFGLLTLWTALITFPLMFAIQEMCARIGMVTSQGLTTNIKKNYSKVWLYFTIFLMIPTLIVNIAANIASMGAVAHMLFPTIPILIYSIFMSLLIVICLIYFSYQEIVSVLKYLCLVLLLYLVVPFLQPQNAYTILKNTFIPTIHWNKEFISILVAILGTTISPYLFFWQSTMSAEESKYDLIPLNKKQFFQMTQDVGVGMLSSNIVMYFIILTTGTILYQNGVNQIMTVEDAAKALEPLAGKLSYILFSLGIIGTGFLSIPVLSCCVSYTLCAAFDCTDGLDKKLRRAKVFYSLIALSIFLGLGLNAYGFNPIKALIFSAILNCLVSPPLLFIILLIGNNKKIMGKNKNGLLSNTLGILTLILLSLSSFAFFYMSTSSE